MKNLYNKNCGYLFGVFVPFLIEYSHWPKFGHCHPVSSWKETLWKKKRKKERKINKPKPNNKESPELQISSGQDKPGTPMRLCGPRVRKKTEESWVRSGSPGETSTWHWEESRTPDLRWVQGSVVSMSLTNSPNESANPAPCPRLSGLSPNTKTKLLGTEFKLKHTGTKEKSR